MRRAVTHGPVGFTHWGTSPCPGPLPSLPDGRLSLLHGYRHAVAPQLRAVPDDPKHDVEADTVGDEVDCPLHREGAVRKHVADVHLEQHGEGEAVLVLSGGHDDHVPRALPADRGQLTLRAAVRLSESDEPRRKQSAHRGY